MSPSSIQAPARRNRMRYLAFLTVLAAAAALFFSTGAAQAATTPTSNGGVTQISNRPDNGHGGFWSFLNMKRTLLVTLAAPQPKSTPSGDLAYNVTITDAGSFTTVLGALTPNQSTVGLKIAHSVKGSVNGTYNLTVFAPADDTLTGVVPTTEDDNFSTTGSGFVSTGDWASQAFASKTGVTVQGGKYEWIYRTVCGEKWDDSSQNGDGNLAADGNITGKLCPVPYVYGGHVVAVSYTGGVVAWKESLLGWPDNTSKCEQVWISGYGFGAWDPNNPTNPGTSHIGFTCDHSGNSYNQGYLRGLTKGHTYALRIVPATGSYGPGNSKPIPGAHVAYVDVFTPAA